MSRGACGWPLAWLAIALFACGADQASDRRGEARDPVQPVATSGESRGVPPEIAEELPAVVEGNSRFGLDLYAALRSREGNLFFSPFSLSTALAMTYAGAAGKTAVEMATVLHLPEPQERLHAGYGALLDGLDRGASEGGYRLEIANRLWGQSGYAFRPAFLAACREHYAADLAELDFRADPEACRATINEWVAEETEEKIQDLIPPRGLRVRTRLVLTNAVYFQGDWDSPFHPDDTRDAPFYLADGKSVQTPLMHQEGWFRFADLDGLKLVELPHEGEDLALLVVLPERPDGLPGVETELSWEKLESWIASLRGTKVDLFLPRFEMTHESGLKETLRGMGMESAFKEPLPGDPTGADFTRMAEERELFIQEVFHKAWVRVDETGTEAAAASAVVMEVTSAPARNVFRADHPFLFFLRDTKTGSLLFMGRLAEPGVQIS